MAILKNQLTKYYKGKGAKVKKETSIFKEVKKNALNDAFPAKIEYKEIHKLTQKHKLYNQKYNVLLPTRTQNRKLQREQIKKNTNIPKEVLKMFSNNMSTFDGIGASSEGFKLTQTGIKIHHRCEINPDANKTYYANNEFIKKNFTEDINELFKSIPIGLKLGFLIQSAPCQSWSSQGKKQLLESKNGELTLTAINLQKKVDANVVTYENVKGQITNGKYAYFYGNENNEIIETRTKKTSKELSDNNLIFLDKVKDDYKSLINPNYKGTVGKPFHILETLLMEDDRYNYYWEILNANNYGLPQNRERIFIVGIKKELDNGFKFPEVKEELDFTVEDILESNVAEKYFYNNTAEHKLIPTNQKRRKNKIHTVAKYADTMTYESTRRVYAPYVVPCITTNNYAKFMIDGRVRTLTPTEAKRIHGFREEFKLVGSITKQNKQLGNTVSPGVYKELFLAILQAIKVPQVKDIQTFTIKKSIINKPDMRYLNITSKKYQKYMDFIANGGKLFLEITKYENMFDKTNKINSKKVVIEIQNLIPKGYRNKKQEVRRYKVVDKQKLFNKKPANNINYEPSKNLINPRNTVLYPWLGSKRKFTNQIQEMIEIMNINKVEYFIDAFGGSMNFTINNIEKVDAKFYVLNDIDPILVKTYKAVKQNYKLVQRIYKKIQNDFLNSVPKEYRRNSSIKDEDRDNCAGAPSFYKRTVNKLNYVTDKYEVAAIFIWMMKYASNGVFEYDKNNNVKNTAYNWKFSVANKLDHIKYYSMVLNKYDVIIENLDVFELINKYSLNDAFIYLDPPYLNANAIYNSDNSDEFQLKLLDRTNHYKYRLYSNEDCPSLYDLGIDNYFLYSTTFRRNTNLGATNKNGREFLAFSINENNQHLERVAS